MAKTKPFVSIENVVASATIDQELDLYMVQKKFPKVEYNPEQFPGLIFKLQSPKTATLLFRTGKMVCTGSKSSQMAKNAVRTVVDNLRNRGIKIKDAKVTIQNMVASVNLGGKIHVEKAATVLPKSMYEPEQFPGLIHRMINPKAVMLVFSSGKLVCAGCKTEEQVYRSVNLLHSILEEKDLMNYE